jgi:hypothetical protein
MRHPVLFGYQLLTGLSDASTGALLIVVPGMTLRLMHIQAPADATPFLSFIGAFVLSVGLACLYGAWLVYCGDQLSKLQTVWLLTAITRSAVAIFVVSAVIAGTLEPGWLTVAAFDGAFALVQANGLRKGWLTDAAR